MTRRCERPLPVVSDAADGDELSLMKVRGACRLKVKPDPGYVLTVHAANDERDTAKADAGAQGRIVGQPSANEIRKRRLVVPLGNGEAIEPGEPAEQNLAGEVEPYERHCTASLPASDRPAPACFAAGSTDSLTKSSRTPAISF